MKTLLNCGVMRTTAAALVAGSLLLTTGGCNSQQKAGEAHVSGKPGATQAAMFDKLKSLAGEWTMPGEDGKTITATVYSVTANGSAVREIMFPGTAHEMTNVYHLDGPSVVVTHYCGAGNQPRMRASSMEKDGSIAFTFDSVTNLDSPTSMYMGGLKLEMPDNNHLTQVWTTLVKGKPSEEHAVFKMTRKGA